MQIWRKTRQIWRKYLLKVELLGVHVVFFSSSKSGLHSGELFNGVNLCDWQFSSELKQFPMIFYKLSTFHWSARERVYQPYYYELQLNHRFYFELSQNLAWILNIMSR